MSKWELSTFALYSFGLILRGVIRFRTSMFLSPALGCWTLRGGFLQLFHTLPATLTPSVYRAVPCCCYPLSANLLGLFAFFIDRSSFLAIRLFALYNPSIVFSPTLPALAMARIPLVPNSITSVCHLATWLLPPRIHWPILGSSGGEGESKDT